MKRLIIKWFQIIQILAHTSLQPWTFSNHTTNGFQPSFDFCFTLSAHFQSLTVEILECQRMVSDWAATSRTGTVWASSVHRVSLWMPIVPPCSSAPRTAHGTAPSPFAKVQAHRLWTKDSCVLQNRALLTVILFIISFSLLFQHDWLSLSSHSYCVWGTSQHPEWAGGGDWFPVGVQH